MLQLLKVWPTASFFRLITIFEHNKTEAMIIFPLSYTAIPSFSHSFRKARPAVPPSNILRG